MWLQYVSHKIGRLIVPWALLGLFASSLALAPRKRLYALALFAQGIFYGLAHRRRASSRRASGSPAIAFTFVDDELLGRRRAGRAAARARGLAVNERFAVQLSAFA